MRAKDRALIAVLGGIVMVMLIVQHREFEAVKAQLCQHWWVSGPYDVWVEHCTNCGVLRIGPEHYRTNRVLVPREH